MKTITCGPGHGISIGSLGKDNSTGIVTEVVLDNAFFRGTTNGLRIKTWQSLGFDLIVYAPYRPLEGFINYMEDYMQVNDEQQETLMVLWETVKIETDKTMLTQAPLFSYSGRQRLGSVTRCPSLMRCVWRH